MTIYLKRKTNQRDSESRYTSIGLILRRVMLALTILKFLPEVPLLQLLLGLLPLLPVHMEGNSESKRDKRQGDILATKGLSRVADNRRDYHNEKRIF
jgi:hypothetical protein